MSDHDHPEHTADADPVDLAAVGAELLEQARGAKTGHASRLLVGGEHQRAMLMALTAGAKLQEHEAPPAATFQVLSGRARLYAVDGPSWSVEAGELVAIPQARHGVEGETDTVILLSVALSG